MGFLLPKMPLLVWNASDDVMARRDGWDLMADEANSALDDAVAAGHNRRVDREAVAIILLKECMVIRLWFF